MNFILFSHILRLIYTFGLKTATFGLHDSLTVRIDCIDHI